MELITFFYLLSKNIQIKYSCFYYFFLVISLGECFNIHKDFKEDKGIIFNKKLNFEINSINETNLFTLKKSYNPSHLIISSLIIPKNLCEVQNNQSPLILG